MKWGAKVLLLTVSILAVSLLIAGCSDNDSPLSSVNDEATTILRVTPADGSTDISPAAPVSIAFSGPVDTLSIRNHFYLAGGEPMHMWRDSLDHHGGFGMMGMGWRHRMVDWMDSIQTPGMFFWNSDLDSCAFLPDEPLDPNTEYLCVLEETGMRDHHGHMIGGDDHDDEGYHMFGFRTGEGRNPGP